MKILYLAKHNSGGNDDEGAITYSLEKLGHTVIRIFERNAMEATLQTADFMLSHHGSFKKGILDRIRMPKVFWCFDLIEYADPLLRYRNRARVSWMNRMVETYDLGFCTDGDWVAKDRSGKLVSLKQGADPRLAGFGQKNEKHIDILFTGIRRGGTGRQTFIDEMKETYGSGFVHAEKIYGRCLSDLIATSKIVVAPDHPTTDKYWSNRVYMALGYGAFMLHPYCADLTQDYVGGREIIYYANRSKLHDQIDYYLKRDSDRQVVQEAALDKTKRKHTYFYRCGKLIDIVKERLF